MIDPITWLKRWRDRRALLRLDDQTLADIGCARMLLLRGVRAWPWQASEDSMARLGRFHLRGEPPVVASAPAATPAPGTVLKARFPGIGRLDGLVSTSRRKTEPAQRMIAFFRG